VNAFAYYLRMLNIGSVNKQIIAKVKELQMLIECEGIPFTVRNEVKATLYRAFGEWLTTQEEE